MSNNASWHFPPTKGGIDYVQDPSSSHFSSLPIANLVREIIQNSLDARQPGLNQVGVSFTELPIQRNDIGGDELRLHIEQCLARATTESRHAIREVYEQALETLSGDTIRCLKIHDTGTTGLREPNWDALVLKEGAVQKDDGTTSPGGSYGIGKNAVLNVSDLMTVFYSTRYISGRKGRTELTQGKATLMAHPDPQRPDGEQLQHIGFYRAHAQEPMKGLHEIPTVFRLDETGTAIYIIGFNPHSSDWVAETKAAVISNFFYCIHHQLLQVTVQPLEGPESVINHQTIDIEFEQLKPDSPAHHYYRTISNQTQGTNARIQAPNPIGPLDVYLVAGTGPRRAAYVNQNGMLISDSKDQQVNPLSPLGRNAWPDYTVVIMPSSKEGAGFLGRMENPNHSTLSPNKLRDVHQQQKAIEGLKQARLAIRSFIDEAMSLAEAEKTTNITELTHHFPEEKPATNRNLLTRIVAENLSTSIETDLAQLPEAEETAGEAPHSAPNIALENARVIPLSGNKAFLAFTLSGTPPKELTVTLRPAGEEPTRERLITIEEAKVLSPNETVAEIHNGALLLTSPPEDRVTVEVSTSIVLGDLAIAMEAR